MYIVKCPVCGSKHTINNGKRYGVQMYVCRDCDYQFRNTKTISSDELWDSYMSKKQTISELAVLFSVSPSTIKRRLHDVSREWSHRFCLAKALFILTLLTGGRNWGILLAVDSVSGMPLYLDFIKVVIIDGIQHLFTELRDYKIQMCQFHMKQIVKRYITLNPRLLISRKLKKIMENITSMDKDTFTGDFYAWKEEWKETLNKRTILKSGKSQYTHKRLRSAMRSIDFYMPYLFTYQEEGREGIPNTNNKIEGTFTSLKNSLRNHSGLREENRKRFISGFFLALITALCKEKQDPQ